MGAAVACIIALIQATGVLERASIVALVVLGALFFSLGIWGLGWLKAPFSVGTPLRTLIILSIVWGGMAFLGYRIWAEQDRKNNVSGVDDCQITFTTTRLHATPMPAQAADTQLASEALVIVESILNLQTSEYNASREASDTSAKPDALEDKERSCATLQEYESSLRIPAQAIQGAMLDRLPLEDRPLSKTNAVIQTYAHPKDTEALSGISDDLLRLVDALQKEKRFTATMPDKQWIVPIPTRDVVPFHHSESNTELAQEFIGPDGFIAQVRWTRRGCQPGFCNLFIVLKSESGHHGEAKHARVLFDEPIMPMMMMLPPMMSNAAIGYDYIDFRVTPGAFSTSTDLSTPHTLKIVGIKKLAD